MSNKGLKRKTYGKRSLNYSIKNSKLNLNQESSEHSSRSNTELSDDSASSFECEDRVQDDESYTNGISNQIINAFGVLEGSNLKVEEDSVSNGENEFITTTNSEEEKIADADDEQPLDEIEVVKLKDTKLHVKYGSHELKHLGLFDSILQKVPLKLHKRKKRTIIKEFTQRDFLIKKLEVRAKYNKEFKLPQVLYHDEIIEAIKPYMDIIIQLLKGKLQSVYYDSAKQAFLNSERAILSAHEFRALDLKKFQAGYYGLRRQLCVGEYIYDIYKEKICSLKSPTARWWGPRDFSSYVLAPELLISVCIEEMGLKDDPNYFDDNNEGSGESARSKAYSILQDTVKFGQIVADTDPMQPWEVLSEEKNIENLQLNVAKYSSRKWRIALPKET
ncbi:hypothetical protein Kpol_2000p40 [Vanderwaltozyma polyspora DSM 70294]|uniref:Restriction of telomere capping protein 4 n=1 Tax=Vanderwaltozyma polyspora (strain ATCC 22028 / DSM 70294 / BCRC 21397 / CBS 2163 / NBRC 10782 / NRRL Y-8283 / UCD 57-17) TaxID=436907 RepID=RTC4_VANPO|nr:uncharacterized protein Kpol_2000p40 [Vanderwaltozyma polyspora DSM 70294]A7TF50.1 RecName: Full=Restriction of telomere capping protein 4 [Vanderwaltozyma polyspora DSM 70294]EDO19075.1 hypothetical protein Kpol_2000p40 [Vanderwaltozyma polyspora DSM 70294]